MSAVLTSRAKPSAKLYKPMAHQFVSMAHADKNPIVFDCSDPGTGKTAARLWILEKRLKQRKVRKAIVFAPKSLLRSVWEADARKFTPTIRTSVSVAGRHDKSFAVDADLYITNTDAVKWLAKQPPSFFKDFDELIIDESSFYKHGTSDRSRAMRKIKKHFKYRSCLTGTPNGNTITDVHHQVLILDDGKHLGESFFAFRNAVCTPYQVGRDKNAIRWEDKEGAEEVVFSMLSDIVIRHDRKKCLDLPPNHTYTRDYFMSDRQRKAYDQMEGVAIAELFGREEYAKAMVLRKKPVPKKHVTAINAAAVRTKLLQIASGAVYDDEHAPHIIDDSRYEFVLDLAGEVKHSVVFFIWKHQRDCLEIEAKKRKLRYMVIDGDVKERDRAMLVKGYQAGLFDTCFLHPRSAAHGVTLTRATRTIWASPTYDAEWFVQGGFRIDRIGQTEETETITVLAADTVEGRVYNDILMPKNKRMTNLLDLFSTL